MTFKCEKMVYNKEDLQSLEDVQILDKTTKTYQDKLTHKIKLEGETIQVGKYNYIGLPRIEEVFVLMHQNPNEIAVEE